MPASERPFDWAFAVRIYERAAHAIRRITDYFEQEREEYGAQLGFSEEGGFWDTLYSEPRELLSISTGPGSGDLLYLRGKTFDTFTGREWTVGYPGDMDDRLYDIMEITATLLREDGPGGIGDHMRREQLGVQILDFDTRYLFAPGRTLVLDGKIDGITCLPGESDLIASSALSYDTSYAYSWYRINQNHPSFAKIAENARLCTEQEWEDARFYILRERFLKDEETGGFSYPAFLSYSERMHSAYLPETKISDKLSVFLKERIPQSLTSYEKLTRLSGLLSAFTYNISPGPLPEEVQDASSFLDHLFFSSQQGYCSHFATAFVLIARSMGIPARYVQGYAVPLEADGETVVDSFMTHAWPEAYLPGLGWLSFEPTPGRKRDSSWMTRADMESQIRGQEQPHPTGGGEVSLPLPEPEVLPEKKPFPFRIVAIPAGLCLGFLLLFFALDRFLSAWKYRRMTVEERFRVRCRGNLKLLGILNLRPERGETLEEFGRRAGAELSGEALTFLASMEKVFYAGVCPDEQMTADAEACGTRIWEQLRKRKGRSAFLYRVSMAGK